MARRAGRAALLAAVLVVSVVGGSVALAGSAAAAPAGFVSVADDQVYSDLPEQTPMGESAKAIADADVMTSSHHETTEVVVTSPGRAKNLIDGGELHGSGPISIVITDDENHEGRTVALPAAEVEDALGFQPEMARGTHDSGVPWNSEIEYQGGWMLVDVPHFSTNTVSFAGEVQIGDTFTTGSSVQYGLTDLDSASDVTVKMTGKTNGEWDNVSGSSVGVNHETPLSVGGNIEPTDGAGGDPVLEVTATNGTYTTNPVNNTGDGTTDGSIGFLGDNNGDDDWESEMQFNATFTGEVDQIHIYVAGAVGSDYGGTSDVHLVNEGVDATKGEGTKVATFDPNWETGWQTISLDTSYNVQEGQIYTVEFTSMGTDGDGTDDYLKYSYDDSVSGWSGYMTSNWYERGPARMKVDVVGGDVNSLDVSDGEGHTHSFGSFTTGETKSTALNLQPSSSKLNFSGSGMGAIDYNLIMQERSQTEDPGVELNDGNWANHSGTLADGETVSYTINKSALQSGTNTINVSMPSLSADAPAMQVAVNYSHDAQDDQSVEYQAEKFSERYNVSKTYSSDRTNPNLTIPFADTAVTIRDAEYRVNGGSWQTTDEWVVSNTTGTIHLPDMQANDTVDVRVNASKVAVDNGAIQVLEATPTADKLDSKIEITEHRSGFAIDVSGIDDERLVYASDESWSEPDAHAYVDASGNQELRLPNAGVGSTTRIQDVPIWATPDNDVEVIVTDAATPRFQLRPGATDGDLVEIEYRDTVSGQAYELRDITNDRPADTDTAESPVFFSTDDTLITYEILETTLSGSDGPVAGAGATSDTGGMPTWLIVLGAVLIGIVALWGVNRKWGSGPSDGWLPSRLVLLGGTVLGIIGVELVTPESALGAVTSGVLESGFGAMFAAVALIVGVLYVDQRTDIEVSLPAYVGVGALVLLFVLETLSGGIVDALAAGLEEVGPLIWLGLIGGGGALIYLWIRAERRPDTQVTLDLGRRGS